MWFIGRADRVGAGYDSVADTGIWYFRRTERTFADVI